MVAGDCGLCINKGNSSVLLYNCRLTRLCFGECQKGKIRLAEKKCKFYLLNNCKIM